MIKSSLGRLLSGRKSDSTEKDLLDYLFNESRAMLSVIDKECRYVRVNPAFCRVLDVKPGFITGKHVEELWGNSTFNSVILPKIKSCLLGHTVKYEADFIVPGSLHKYFEITFYPLKSSQGDISGILAESYDLTELKLSLRSVSNKADELTRLENTIPAGLLRCNPDGTIVHFNNNFMKMVECQHPDQIKGASIRDFYSEKSLFDIHLLQLKKGEPKALGRVTLVTLNNRDIKCRVNGFAINDLDNPSGNLIDIALEDVSREVMLENSILQAKRLETIGSLAGGVAHDFNNLLGSILGYTEILMDELKENKEATEIAGRIVKSGARARALTSQLLAFSRQIEQKRIPVRVAEIIEEAVSVISSLLKPGMTIREKIANPDVMVSADPTQLFRVFLNLMTNAVQAMEEKGGVLTITLGLADGDTFRNETASKTALNKYALVRIEDTGVGMEEAVMSRIFEPYYTTREFGKGTGLGLSVVYGIVNELDGDISVKSQKGKGSLFSVFIPSTDTQPESAVNINAESVRILLVSGGSHESRILAGALRKSGYHVDTASDGNEIADIHPDRLKGLSVLIYICEQDVMDQQSFEKFIAEKDVRAPLIFIAEGGCDVSGEKLLNSGIAKHFLFKPVSLREIITAIQLI